MSDFIQGDNFDRDGGEAEEIVWKKVKEAFLGREVLGYSRYPLFSQIGEKKKEPDILLLDKELGLIVIEVKAFNISNIEYIEANNWIIKDSYSRTVNPLGQAEDYLYKFKAKFDGEKLLRNKVRLSHFVAIPNILKNQWEERGFNTKTDNLSIIFGDDLSKRSLMDVIAKRTPEVDGIKLDDNNYRLAQSILGHENNHVSEVEDSMEIGTKGRIYSEVKNKLFDLDIQQEGIGKVIAPGPQRIRGIAGSGKTLLICQKAAYMHLKHPEWKIAVTFYTQSLYDTIINTLDMYLKAFSDGEVSYDEQSNLKVLHAWGRANKNGLYREISARNNCRFLNATDVKKKLGGYVENNISINYISKELLEECNGNLEEIFDAIFIDEGQDLIADDKYKYKGKQAFYYMAYKSLKPVSDENCNIRRLIWAYDELQSLNDKKIPSSKEILGDSSLVTGIYKGGAKKSEIMKKCYRTPHEILTSAHAIGMGFFRVDGMLSGYTTQRDWENVGYKVISGDFKREGNEIVLERPIENSPNPMNNLFKGKCIEFKTYTSRADAIKELVINIKNDIENQNLKPSRDILIINLSEGDNGGYLKEIGYELNRADINYYIPSCSTSNIIKDNDWRRKKPEKFWCDNAVTISAINRAKGNEAAMVYVVGVEYIAKNEGSVAERNKLFTALTRAKCWVKVMGVGSYTLYREIQKAIESKGIFRFKYSKPKNESNDIEIN